MQRQSAMRHCNGKATMITAGPNSMRYIHEKIDLLIPMRARADAQEVGNDAQITRGLRTPDVKLPSFDMM
jgi:hypothetical protein